MRRRNMQKKIQSGSFIFHMYRVRLSNITSNYNIIITVDEPNGLRGGHISLVVDG